MPRSRDRILANLESLYRESFERARDAGDDAERERLDFGFRRDQLYLEAILDVRDLLVGLAGPAAGRGGSAGSGSGSGGGAGGGEREERSLLDQVEQIRRLTRFPFGR